MDERRDNTELILEEINTQLRHIKWIMVAGLITVLLLLLTVIGLVFFPVLAGLFIVAFLVVGPVAYLYHVYAATVPNRETRVRTSEQDDGPLLRKAAR